MANRTLNEKLCAIAFAILIISLSSAACAHSVTMNWRFHIADINDATHNGTNYVSAERNGVLAALAFAGNALTNIKLDKASDPYLFRITQDENQNRFLLAVTAGSWQDIESAPSGKIPATTFGRIAEPVVAQGLALQLRFDGLDLLGTLSPGQLLVKSLGVLRTPVIELKMV